MSLACIILAAGQGTRMKSSLPKVLHNVCGKSMIYYVLSSAYSVKPARCILVLGHGNKEVSQQLPEQFPAKTVIQRQQLGTAHAVSVAVKKLGGHKGDILVLYGDTPLITPQTLKSLVRTHQKNKADVTMLTTILDNPTGYGRIVRSKDGRFAAIVEQADASSNQKKIKEVNPGIYIFKATKLLSFIKKVSKNNAQGEYYLTDVVGYLASAKAKVETLDVCADEVQGINSLAELALAEKIMRGRINEGWMAKGVTLVDPETTYIDYDVKLGPDTTILPGCLIRGNTKIGSEATIGPFSHLREGTVIKNGAKVGAFCEIKNSVIAENSKVPHLSYIGDAVVGKNVNIGAGSITCNYDGKKKHKTIIEDGAFLGSDTMLIAPVKIGKGAITGAASAITSDVPAGALGLERSKQKNIKNYNVKKKQR
ncbi:MAG: bifunctional N-acetylglucosamine-1-phosphate uridyltransferase/glucosamine-1-phosphate acetyltransferase [Actinobacteria bacterium]|nr:MAG: bifunctional N-acetylglucosamine-1-phosphate uridyltransferase/glucosamine-1-phosphate acetyltransferase [Actinomycetota bacterium]